MRVGWKGIIVSAEVVDDVSLKVPYCGVVGVSMGCGVVVDLGGSGVPIAATGFVLAKMVMLKVADCFLSRRHFSRSRPESGGVGMESGGIAILPMMFAQKSTLANCNTNNLSNLPYSSSIPTMI